jgi:hypothetical protein
LDASGLSHIWCEFPSRNATQLHSLVKGQRVSVKGVCQGTAVLAAAQLNNCTLVDILQTQEEVKQDDLTLEKFNRVQIGMTYEEVDAILGENWEIMSKSEFGDTLTERIKWKSNELLGGNILLTFRNGQVVSKVQFGLK